MIVKCCIIILIIPINPRFSQNIVPGCLWLDKVNTPYSLRTFGYEKAMKKDTNLHLRPRSPLFNEDCKRFFKDSSILNSHICVENLYTTNDVCLDKSGDILQAIIERNNINIPFIVGIKSYDKSCKDAPSVYTKISEHVDWIKAAIYSE